MPVPEIPTETLLWCYRSCIIQVHTVFPSSAEYRVPRTEMNRLLAARRLVMLASFCATQVHIIPVNQTVSFTNDRIPRQLIIAIMQSPALPLPSSTISVTYHLCKSNRFFSPCGCMYGATRNKTCEITRVISLRSSALYEQLNLFRLSPHTPLLPHNDLQFSASLSVAATMMLSPRDRSIFCSVPRVAVSSLASL